METLCHERIEETPKRCRVENPAYGRAVVLEPTSPRRSKTDRLTAHSSDSSGRLSDRPQCIGICVGDGSCARWAPQGCLRPVIEQERDEIPHNSQPVRRQAPEIILNLRYRSFSFSHVFLQEILKFPEASRSCFHCFQTFKVLDALQTLLASVETRRCQGSRRRACRRERSRQALFA